MASKILPKFGRRLARPSRAPVRPQWRSLSTTPQVASDALQVVRQSDYPVVTQDP